jgi:hypothetical protein
MSRGNIAGVPTLLEQLLDQTERDPETVSHLGPRTLSVVI